MEEILEPLERLAAQYSKLPGIGRKTAMRLALASLEGDFASSMISSLSDAKEQIGTCKLCHNICVGDYCGVCLDEKRDKNVICVVSDFNSVMAIERIGGYNGVYHVLGGLLSPIKGITADRLNMADLFDRITPETREVLIATNSTLEGEATAMYIAKKLRAMNVRVSALASGIPAGANIEYADETTLRRAIEGRHEL